jgi:hypothetical protein
MRILCKSRLLHHHKAINAFTYGLQKSSKADIDYFDHNNLPTGKYDFAICWGLRAMEKLKAYTKTKNCLVFENAYLNNVQSVEKEWVSLGWNGLNGRADFCNKNSPADRWKKHFDNGRLKEYTDGDYILIPLQIQGDQSLNYIWSSVLNYQYICETIRKFTDIPIVIKDHPTFPGSQPEVKGIKNLKYIDTNMPIEKAISKAKVVVTINSNAGVDSILGGKPVVSLDKGSMVWNISANDLKSINTPKFYDRIQWCKDIAYAQWHPRELKTGEAWDHLKSKLKL